MSPERTPRLIPGLVDRFGSPLLMPYDEEGWRHWYIDVLKHRRRVQEATEGTDDASLKAREAQARLCAQPGADGLLYFLNTFGSILEPRNAGNPKTANLVNLPWITWPRQTELADEYEAMMETPRDDPEVAHLSNMAAIKSRDVGLTWMDVAHTAKQWLTASYWFHLVVSTNFALAADDKDIKSYFYKLHYLLKRIPEWLLPEGFSGFGERKEHDKTGLLINPVTGAQIKASTTTDDAGRGDRVTLVTLEEAGTHEAFGRKWNNAVLVANHVVAIGTPETKEGYDWYNLVHGREGYTKPRIFTFWWHEVPGRDAQWYAAISKIMSEDERQRELDLNWLAGTGDFLYPIFQTKEAGYFPFVPGWPTRIVMDDGWDDHYAITIVQKDLQHRRVRVVAGYYNSGMPLRFYGQLLRCQPSGQFHWGERERDLMDWLSQYHVVNEALFYGDRHGDNTELGTGKSPFGILAEEFGIYVLTAKDPARNDLKFRRDALNSLAPIIDFDQQHGAYEVLDALKFSRLPHRRSSSQASNEVKDAPHIQKPSHYAACMQYYAVNEREEWSASPSYGGARPRATVSGFSPRPPTTGRRHSGVPHRLREESVAASAPTGWGTPWTQ